MIKRIFYRLFILFFRFFPLRKNFVLLSNFNGNPYGDNIKYITEELRKNSKLKFFLIVDKFYSNDKVPSYVIQVKLKSIKLAYLLETSKIIISNVRMGFFYKRTNQLYIQTWHGNGAMKKSEKDIIEVLDPGYVKGAQRDSKRIDIFLSGSRFLTELFFNSFWYSNYVCECGCPRCDVLLREDAKIRKKVYNSLSIQKEKTICLYAPTFRNVDSTFHLNDLNFFELKEALDKKFNRDFVILVRAHSNARKTLGRFKFDNNFIINATDYPDVMELLSVSSVLVSDYSSILHDFAFKYGPAFRFVPDLDEYRKDWGTYFSFDEYPYPYATESKELCKLIMNFDEAKYNRQIDLFNKKIGLISRSDSSVEVSELISQFLSCKTKKEFLSKASGVLLTKESLIS